MHSQEPHLKPEAMFAAFCWIMPLTILAILGEKDDLILESV